MWNIGTFTNPCYVNNPWCLWYSRANGWSMNNLFPLVWNKKTWCDHWMSSRRGTRFNEREVQCYVFAYIYTHIYTWTQKHRKGSIYYCFHRMLLFFFLGVIYRSYTCMQTFASRVLWSHFEGNRYSRACRSTLVKFVRIGQNLHIFSWFVERSESFKCLQIILSLSLSLSNWCAVTHGTCFLASDSTLKSDQKTNRGKTGLDRIVSCIVFFLNLFQTRYQDLQLSTIPSSQLEIDHPCFVA